MKIVFDFNLFFTRRTSKGPGKTLSVFTIEPRMCTATRCLYEYYLRSATKTDRGRLEEPTAVGLKPTAVAPKTDRGRPMTDLILYKVAPNRLWLVMDQPQQPWYRPRSPHDRPHFA